MVLRDKQRSKRRAAGRSFITLHHETSLHTPSPRTSTVQELCVRGWWRDRLVHTSEALKAHLPSFSSYLESLRIAQKRMHVLARKRTQARLYPNPASTNSKSLLNAQLSTLEADMVFCVKSQDPMFFYVSTLMFAFNLRPEREKPIGVLPCVGHVRSNLVWV